MRCMVTGGSGFIGGHLARRLAADGHEVHAVARFSSGRRHNLPPAVRLHEAGLNSPALQDAFAEARPEIVFHLAAQASLRRSVEDPVSDAEQNVLGTVRLLECARAAGVGKVVYASSGGTCYGQPERLPAEEDALPSPLSPYGVSKYAGEKYVEMYGRLHGMRWTALRFANVYGPGQDPRGNTMVISIFCRMMLQGERPRIYGDGSKTRDYVYVDDAVDALTLAMDRGDGRAYNVGAGRPISDRELFEAVRDALGADIEPIYEEWRAGDVMHIYLDTARIKNELGWTPKTPFAEGVRRAVEQFRADWAGTG